MPMEPVSDTGMLNALNDTNSVYGRFARGFDVANAKNCFIL